MQAGTPLTNVNKKSPIFKNRASGILCIQPYYNTTCKNISSKTSESHMAMM